MAPPSSRVTEMKSMMTRHAQDLANSRGGQKKEQIVWCNSYRPASDLKCLSKSGISQALHGASSANPPNSRRKNSTSNLGGNAAKPQVHLAKS
jgi:hypothetical protein